MKSIDTPKTYYLEGGINSWIEEGLLAVFSKTIEPSVDQRKSQFYYY